MKGRVLWNLAITTLPDAEEAVTEMLQKHFELSAVAYADLETGKTSVGVFLPRRPRWPAARNELRKQLGKIRACGLKTGRAAISLRRLSAQDWAESWKRHFRPQLIGDKLLIKPSWSRRKPQRGQPVVVLDPGLSFGTGQHPTTAFCLEEIVRAARPSSPFLDIGTGSGILAIAAAALGYEPIHAFDNDPESLRVARANALQNHVRIFFALKDVRKFQPQAGRKYSLVCANLVSNLLLEEKARITGCVAPDGLLVLAGILATEFKEVQRGYEQAGMRLFRSGTQGEWRSGSFVFRREKLKQDPGVRT